MKKASAEATRSSRFVLMKRMFRASKRFWIAAKQRIGGPDGTNIRQVVGSRRGDESGEGSKPVLACRDMAIASTRCDSPDDEVGGQNP